MLQEINKVIAYTVNDSFSYEQHQITPFEDVYNQLFQHNGLKEGLVLDKHIFIDSGQKGGQLEVD